MKKEDKIYCINNLVSMCLRDLKDLYPEKDPYELLNDFLNSKTYIKLCDTQTRLWAEGPVYITDMYLKEKHNN